MSFIRYLQSWKNEPTCSEGTDSCGIFQLLRKQWWNRASKQFRFPSFILSGSIEEVKVFIIFNVLIYQNAESIATIAHKKNLDTF